MSASRRRSRDHGGLVPGLIMMAVGLVFLLDRFDVISVRQIWRYWPMVVIAIGLGHLVRPGGGRPSIFLLLIGVWLQISTLELWGLDFSDSWPLLIIFIGASFVFDAMIGGGGSGGHGRGGNAPHGPPPLDRESFVADAPPAEPKETFATDTPTDDGSETFASDRPEESDNRA